jgi:hypothetical protein
VLRSICAVLISVVTWFLVATVGNWLLRAVLPGYAAVEATMSFTFPISTSTSPTLVSDFKVMAAL